MWADGDFIEFQHLQMNLPTQTFEFIIYLDALHCFSSFIVTYLVQLQEYL